MNHTILAVDDFTMNLRLIQEFLSDYSKVYVARTGKDALETMQRTKIDLFLLDLKMPEMPGIELLSRIRQMKEYKETPVIIISAKSDSVSLRETAAYGISDYIVKPFAQELLCEKVSKALKNAGMCGDGEAQQESVAQQKNEVQRDGAAQQENEAQRDGEAQKENEVKQESGVHKDDEIRQESEAQKENAL